MSQRTPTAVTLALALLLALPQLVAANDGEPPGLDATVDLAAGDGHSAFDLYRALARAAGLAVVFDPQLENREVDFELAGATVRQGLDRLARATGHFYTFPDQRTLMVAPDTPENRREHEPIVIRTFYLENTDVKDMMSLLRTLVDAKRVTAVEGLNAITLRDTPGRVAIAEQLVRRHEKQRAEVAVTAEVLVLDREALEGREGGELPLRLSAAELAELKSSTAVRTLAAPQLAALEGTRAQLLLGEAIPIYLGAAGGEEGKPAVSYQDVGLELAIEPQVHPAAGEVTLTLHVGLSGVVGGPGADRHPVVARRSVDSEVRLRDGETCLLSGLLRVEERPDSRLAALPLLAGEWADNHRELALALTVRIVRRPLIAEEDLRPLPVGTEARMELPAAAD